MIIKNKNKIDTTGQRKEILNLIEEGVKKVIPERLMEDSVSFEKKDRVLTVKGNKYQISGRVFVMGAGKASGKMAQALEKIMGKENITAGVVNTKYRNCNTEKIKINQASHPIPSQNSIKGTSEIFALKDKYEMGKDDLIINLVSGGGSSLLCYPVDEINLRNQQIVVKMLLRCGAEIAEINTIRKHLSKVKGGKLGKFFEPSTVVSLIISDVPGNDLSVIASGPTFSDRSNFTDAIKILRKYNLASEVPRAIIEFLEKGEKGESKKTVKDLSNCHNYLIGSGKTILEHIKKESRKLGYIPLLVNSQQTGRPSRVSSKIATEIKKGKYENYDLLILGGETTPEVPSGAGRGGRNQHYGAVSILDMEDYSGVWTMASFATDGVDFLDGIAGVFVDNNTLSKARKRRINVKSYIKNYDTFSLFKKIGGCLIKAESTGTNVGDIMIYAI